MTDEDGFHPPATDDPFWTETAWFGFAVPERRLTGAVYPLFRPNLGICAAGVHVWDDTAEAAHEVLYSRTWWHLPMPDHDLRSLRLPCGLSYDCMEPGQQYRIRFRDGGEIDLDLVFRGIHPPHVPMSGEHGHLDQAGRVEGWLRLHGESIDVACFEMRDRSWSVRRDSGPVRAAYDYGIAGPDHAFLAMSMFAGDHDAVIAGYHLVHGDVVRLTGGRREAQRENGRPARVHIDARDERGGELLARGECVNRFAFQSSPNYFAWMSMSQWAFDGTTGPGEDQDVWSPDRWRAFIHSRS